MLSSDRSHCLMIYFSTPHIGRAAAHPKQPQIPHDLAVRGVIVADLAYILPLLTLCLLIFERLFIVMRTGGQESRPPFPWSIDQGRSRC